MQGKSVVVTGAGRSIGLTIAREVAKMGANVVVNDINKDNAEAAVAELKALGVDAVVNTDSIASWDGANNMIKQAVDTFGRIDAVVNNAGILRDIIFHKMTKEDFDEVVDVHLRGYFYVSRAAVNLLS